MADVKQMRIFCAEQIEVPDSLPEILKNYSKRVIRENPEDLVDFSRKYFEELRASRSKTKNETEIPQNQENQENQENENQENQNQENQNQENQENNIEKVIEQSEMNQEEELDFERFSKEIKQFSDYLFDKIDKDHSGFISKRELKNYVQNELGEDLSARQIKREYFEKIDFDDDGKIDREEFETALWFGVELADLRTYAEFLFNKIDKDKSGFISFKELKKYLRKEKIVTKKTNKEIKAEIFEQMDLDDDGKIDFQEFLIAMLRGMGLMQ
jgi:Ca2+-binding EF-hand superfamily protein